MEDQIFRTIDDSIKSVKDSWSKDIAEIRSLLHELVENLTTSKSTPVEFRRFSGEDPEVWISQAERYFEFYGTSKNNKLLRASIYLDGEALEWFRWLLRNKQLMDWEHFVAKVRIRFRTEHLALLEGHIATIKEYSTEIEAQVLDNMSHGCCCSKVFGTERVDINVLTDAMGSDSNNGNSEDVQVFDESSHRDEVSASLVQFTPVSEVLVSASIDPIKGSSATREGEVFDNFSQAAAQTFQEFSPMADDFEIICPVLSKELESESEDYVNTHLIIHAYRLPFIIGNGEVVESLGVNGLLIMDGIRLMHEHISIYLPFDPGESVPPHILFEHLKVHLDKSLYLPITLHSGAFSLAEYIRRYLKLARFFIYTPELKGIPIEPKLIQLSTSLTISQTYKKDHVDSFRQLPNVVHNGHFMVVMHKELKLESSLLVSKDEYATQATIFGLHIFIDGVNDFLLSAWPSITNNAKDLVPTMLPEDTKQRSTSAKVIEQPSFQWEEAADKPIDHIVLSKLKQFRVIGNLMKPAIKVIAADFSEEEIKYLKYMFVSMATNNSETITYERIKSGLARLASKLLEAKVLQLMQACVLKCKGSFYWITLFQLQDKIHGATSHLARLILRPNGDANCCTVMLLLAICEAKLLEEKTNYPTVALHLLFVVDKAGGIVVNLRDSVWDNGLEVCNKADALGSIRPGAKLRKGPMTKQPNRMGGHYIWDPGGIQRTGIMLQLWLKTVLLISSSESLPHPLSLSSTSHPYSYLYSNVNFQKSKLEVLQQQKISDDKLINADFFRMTNKAASTSVPLEIRNRLQMSQLRPRVRKLRTLHKTAIIAFVINVRNCELAFAIGLSHLRHWGVQGIFAFGKGHLHLRYRFCDKYIAFVTHGSPIQEGRKLTLSECLKQKFRLSINILRTIISSDIYDGIRAIIIDKANSPNWYPPTLEKVKDEQLTMIFTPFEEHLELQIRDKEEFRWDGKYENSVYYQLNQEKNQIGISQSIALGTSRRHSAL
uniref:Uncharacterized protein LOC104236431 n=1 Tax=Nicotiana sylvestris TaxID=4096 RepID=A0A1U7XG66_NICSY|nr:PREDICTED: uncharacterized protein LOC104236431 [Nicotiana sylvestris]